MYPLPEIENNNDSIFLSLNLLKWVISDLPSHSETRYLCVRGPHDSET